MIAVVYTPTPTGGPILRWHDLEGDQLGACLVTAFPNRVAAAPDCPEHLMIEATLAGLEMRDSERNGEPEVWRRRITHLRVQVESEADVRRVVAAA